MAAPDDAAAAADAVLAFWFGREGEPGYGGKRRQWFKKSKAFDAEIRARFEPVYARAAAGDYDVLAGTPRGALALIVMLDQFPRNMYRGRPAAFATDGKALAVARRTVDAELDRELLPVMRMFVYLPFQHSEDLDDQRRSVALCRGIVDDPACADALEWAERHLEIIERFGRFPHRNAILGRASTPEETAFLGQPNSSF